MDYFPDFTHRIGDATLYGGYSQVFLTHLSLMAWWGGIFPLGVLILTQDATAWYIAIPSVFISLRLNGKCVA
jgi:hypothetical protein